MFLRKAQGRKKDREMPIREVVVNWQRRDGEPSAAWRRLWARLLQKKEGASPDKCKTIGGDESERGESL